MDNENNNNSSTGIMVKATMSESKGRIYRFVRTFEPLKVGLVQDNRTGLPVRK